MDVEMSIHIANIDMTPTLQYAVPHTLCKAIDTGVSQESDITA